MMSRIYLKMLQQRKGRLREDAPSRRNRECGAPETSKGQGEVGAGGQRRDCLGSGPAEETSQGGDSTPEGVESSAGEGRFVRGGAVSGHRRLLWAGATSPGFPPSSAQEREGCAPEPREAGHGFARLAGSFIFPLPRADRECHLLWLWAPSGDHVKSLSWWSSLSSWGDAQETHAEVK